MRRILLLSLMATLLAGAVRAANEDDWRLAVKGRSYMLVGMDFFQTLEKMSAAGVKYIDVTPSQKIGGGIDGTMDYKMDAATREKVTAKLKETGVSMPIYGTAKIDSEQDCKQLFDFCKAMGVEVIMMEPKAEHMAMLDKYCNEYGMSVAIHNHPQPSHYWNVETVLEACQGRSKRIGACADTGHWMRSGLDPLECLKKLDGRIVMLHFKDVAPDASPAAKAPKKTKAKKKAAAKVYRDVEWGKGDCHAAAMMAELRRQGFKGYFSMEYEHAPSFLENLPKNIAFFEKCKGLSEAELKALDK